MRKAFVIAVRCIWVFSVVVTGIAFGALYGWEQHGLVGAIALGFVGLVVSAFIASSPALLLQFLP